MNDKSHVPAALSMLATLKTSLVFLGKGAFGGCTTAEADRLLRNYARECLDAGRATHTTVGQQHVDIRQPYIVMSNHSSLLDIPAMLLAYPGSVRMVAKEELSRVPIWGRAMKGAGFVPIDRSNRAKAIAQLEVAKKQLASGISIWISPEGTRSRDGRLHPFKKGGFHLALDLGLPILPAWIEGTHSIIQPKSFAVRRGGHVEVRFGPPIATQGHRADNLAPIMTEVRQAILALSGRSDVDAVAGAS